MLLVGLVVAPGVAGPLLLAKLGADLLVLAVGARRMGARLPLRAFLPFELYLFGYVLLLPSALLLAPRLTWKGRRW